MEEEGHVAEGSFPAAKHVNLLLDFGAACGKGRQEIQDAQKNGELMAGLLGLQSWCTVQSEADTRSGRRATGETRESESRRFTSAPHHR